MQIALVTLALLIIQIFSFQPKARSCSSINKSSLHSNTIPSQEFSTPPTEDGFKKKENLPIIPFDKWAGRR